MTVLVREDVNAADLAWAANNASVAHVMAQALRARATVAAEAPVGEGVEVLAPLLAGSTAWRAFG